MSLFSTPTPEYKDQGQRPEPRPSRLRYWLSLLLRTPTPAYKKARPHSETTNGGSAE